MATTIINATLTVTLTESVTLNGSDQGATNAFNVSTAINETVKRLVTVTTTECGLLGFSADPHTDLGKSYLAGQFDEDDVRYIRVTNKDDANHVVLTFKSEGNAEFAIKLDAGYSFIYPCDLSGGVKDTMDASASALTVSLEDLVDVTALADTASVDLEVFVASI